MVSSIENERQNLKSYLTNQQQNRAITLSSSNIDLIDKKEFKKSLIKQKKAVMEDEHELTQISVNNKSKLNYD